MSGPTPCQKVKGHTKIKLAKGNTIAYLDAGSFIKVVSKCYMPANHPFGDYDETFWVAASTKLGFALIERSDVTFDVY